MEDNIKVIEYEKKSEIMEVTAKRMAPKDKNIYSDIYMTNYS